MQRHNDTNKKRHHKALSFEAIFGAPARTFKTKCGVTLTGPNWGAL